MRRFSLAAALLLSACSREPQGPSCPPDPEAPAAPVVTVTGDFPGPRIRRDLDARGMDAFDGGAVLPGHDRRGLTRTEWSLDTTVHTRDREVRGGVCLAVSAVLVRVDYKTLEVLLDRNLPESSCLYREILAHEQEHVQVRADAHMRLKELIRETLASSHKLPTARRPLLAKTSQEARQAAQDAAQALVQAAAKTVADEAAARNARIDSPESYAALAGRCPR